MNKKTGTALVIAAGALWGIISLFIKPLAALGFDSKEIAFLRVLTSALMLLCIIAVKDRRLLKIKLKDVWIFIGTGIVSVTFFNICYFATMIDAGSSVAVSLLYTSPVFVMLFSAILFHEKITPKKVVAIVLTIGGVILISGMIGSGTKLGFLSLLVGIGAGFFYGLYSVFGRYGTEKYHPLTITFYTFVFASLGSLFLANPITTFAKTASAPTSIPLVIVSTLLCAVLPYVFYTAGLKVLDTAVAGVLVAVEPLIGSVIGIAVFREEAPILKVIGILLILASIVLLSVTAKKKKTENN